MRGFKAKFCMGVMLIIAGLILICCSLPSWMWLCIVGAALAVIGCCILKVRR